MKKNRNLIKNPVDLVYKSLDLDEDGLDEYGRTIDQQIADYFNPEANPVRKITAKDKVIILREENKSLKEENSILRKRLALLE